MPRPWCVIAAALLLVACGPSSASARAELCQDLINLDATVMYLAAPPPDATVGDVRGALEKIDSTWQAVHDDPDVPDAEDAALLDARDAYEDEIHDVGDDDPFATQLSSTRGIAGALADAYEAVRARLACTASASVS
jgi:hypothetical protein